MKNILLRNEMIEVEIIGIVEGAEAAGEGAVAVGEVEEEITGGEGKGVAQRFKDLKENKQWCRTPLNCMYFQK